MKILVVDDSLVDRMIVRRYLLSMGHEIVLAEDGREAISLFKQQEPDLVLLDVRMPEMDGYHLVQVLRELEQGWRPILFLSNSIDSESFVKGICAGADDFLHKPIDKLILKAKIFAMERIVAMRRQLLIETRELAKETEKATLMANQDGLTGIPNRRFLDQVLDREFRRHVRSLNTFSIILIDIDFFKSFNDHFGHLAGDDALRLCAQKMSELVCRAGDVVARFGGEEFCVVLPNTEPEGAKNMAETLRKAIETLNIVRDDLGGQQFLTISLGVFSFKAQEKYTLDDLVSKADDALYQAKQAGRNQVCVAGS
ncbi:MAG: diguanylate cyclase [Methylococcaceae bacterium]